MDEKSSLSPQVATSELLPINTACLPAASKHSRCMGKAVNLLAFANWWSLHNPEGKREGNVQASQPRPTFPSVQTTQLRDRNKRESPFQKRRHGQESNSGKQWSTGKPRLQTEARCDNQVRWLGSQSHYSWWDWATRAVRNRTGTQISSKSKPEFEA